MMTGVSDTSIDNYVIHRASGRLGRQQLMVLAVMGRGRDYSRAELAQLTGMRLSSVCGRVNELLELKRLTEAPTRACKVTGRTVHPVYLVPDLFMGEE